MISRFLDWTFDLPAWLSVPCWLVIVVLVGSALEHGRKERITACNESGGVYAEQRCQMPKVVP